MREFVNTLGENFANFNEAGDGIRTRNPRMESPGGYRYLTPASNSIIPQFADLSSLLTGLRGGLLQIVVGGIGLEPMTSSV